MGNCAANKVETPREDPYVQFVFSPSVNTPVVQEDTPAVADEPAAVSKDNAAFNKALPKILSNDTIYKDGDAGTPEIGGDVVTTPSIDPYWNAAGGAAEEEVAAADGKVSDLKAGLQINWKAAAGRNGPLFVGDPVLVKAAVNQFWVDAADVELGKLIGKGSFGNVYSAMYRFSRAAVKAVDPANYMSEGTLFFQVTAHPNVCRFHGIYHHEQQYFMVMEHMRDGSLLAYLKNNEVGIDKLWQVCGQITAGVFHCHNSGVIHGDIAARNILVDSREQRVCLTDFGLACKAPATNMTPSLAPRWASPELLRSRMTSFSSDVWAVGVTFWELMTGGAKPYPTLSQEQLVKKLMDEELFHPHIDDEWPEEMKQLMVEIFQPEENRPTMKAIATTCAELRFANDDE